MSGRGACLTRVSFDYVIKLALEVFPDVAGVAVKCRGSAELAVRKGVTFGYPKKNCLPTRARSLWFPSHILRLDFLFPFREFAHYTKKNISGILWCSLGFFDPHPHPQQKGKDKGGTETSAVLCSGGNLQ